MTEPTTPTTITIPPPAPAQEPEPAEPKPETDWKAEARKWEQRAKEYKPAADELAQLKESQKTEAQRLAERAETAERDAAEARKEALRARVGAAKRLPADVVELLRGDTEDELTAHADRLAEHFKASVRPAGSVDQGPRGSAPAATPRDQFADFLKKQMG